MGNVAAQAEGRKVVVSQSQTEQVSLTHDEEAAAAAEAAEAWAASPAKEAEA